MKMTPGQIRDAYTAVERVKSIDANIEWLGKDAPDRVTHYGEKIRHLFGQNRMGNFTDCELGETVLCAVINRLLEKREQEVAGARDVVDFPHAPCPRQVVQEAD